MNHIDQTIADLEAARDRAVQLIGALREFQAGCNGVPPAPTLAAPELRLETTTDDAPRDIVKPPARRRAVRPATVPQGTKKPGKPNGKHHPRGTHTAALSAALETITKPFTAVELARAAGTPLKVASNFMTVRVTNGTFTRVGHGRCDWPAGRNRTFTPDNVTQVAALAVPEVASYDKPTTCAAAMKLVIRNNARFTSGQLRDALMQDRDYAKLVEQSPTSGPGNLLYWTNQGYLELRGEVYHVTARGKEWFAK